VGGGDFGADLTLDPITSDSIASSVIEPSPARQTGSDARAEVEHAILVVGAHAR
jgi:hypothetical protein